MSTGLEVAEAATGRALSLRVRPVADLALSFADGALDWTVAR